MVQEFKTLTAEQVDFFLENGYVVLKRAFTREKAEEWMRDMWVRLGVDPEDKATWTQERVHMPVRRREEVASFAPKAWEAIKELLGGEERIDAAASSWGDSFIVNFGTPALEGAPSAAPQELDNWHVDGDFFVHFLDSPEQALLVIPVFSDIAPRGGGTYIAPDGIARVARHLLAHPEGVVPAKGVLVPSTSACADPRADPGFWAHGEEIRKCAQFVEVTGEVGDVVLLHPLMLHSASKNHLRAPRVITNPPVGLREPFNFNRDDPGEYSLVERKTLRALGVDRVDFRPTTERRRIVPQRVQLENAMLQAERARLRALEHSAPDAGAVPIAVA